MERKIVGLAALFGGFWVVVAGLVFLLFPESPIVSYVSDGFPLILSLAGVLLSLILWRQYRHDRTSTRIWGLMSLGLGFFALGEAIWTVYELVLHQDVPYPSIADIAWLIGYIPLWLSLAFQFDSLHCQVSTIKKALIGLFAAAMAVLTAWLVLWPIWISPDTGSAAEQFFSIAYPVEDLFLLVIGATLVFILFGGRLALSWGSIAGGVLLFALSDLLFSYGTWNNLYYPEGRLNLLSAGFDILYIGAYALWIVGLILRWRLPDAGQDLDVHRVLAEGTGAEGATREYLILANDQGRIVFIDPPLVELLGQADAAPWWGKPFAQLIGMDTRAAEDAIRKADRRGISDSYRVPLGRNAEPYQLTVISSKDKDQNTGFDILLHRASERTVSQADRESLLLSQIALRAREYGQGSRMSTQEGSLRVYFNTLIGLFYILVCRAGGGGLGSGFEGEINRKASGLGCRLILRKGHLVWNEDQTDPTVYQALLETAVEQTRQAVSPATLGRKMQEIERFLPPQVVMAAEENRLRMIRWLDNRPAGTEAG